MPSHRQDKVWVTGPAGERWEVYTVLADSETFGISPGNPGGTTAQASPACCGDDVVVVLGYLAGSQYKTIEHYANYLGLALLVAIAAFFFLRHRREQRQDQQPAST
jgi:hypothetical protein